MLSHAVSCAKAARRAMRWNQAENLDYRRAGLVENTRRTGDDIDLAIDTDARNTRNVVGLVWRSIAKRAWK